MRLRGGPASVTIDSRSSSAIQEFYGFTRNQQKSTTPSEKLQQCWQDIVARAEKSELGKQSAIASQRDKKRLLLGTGIFMFMILYVSWLVVLTGIIHD